MAIVDSKPRAVARIVAGQATSDGAGVRLIRIIGGSLLPDLDPFLLLDEFGSDDPPAYIAGFPDHPHRGEPVARYGPFVMNTTAERRQAVADFQSGKF